MTLAVLRKESIELRLVYRFRFSSLLSWWEARCCTGKHGVGERNENSTSESADSRKRDPGSSFIS